MAFDVQAARDAGYSQEEINAYLQGQPKTEKIAPVAPGQEIDPGEPPPPEGTITPAGEGSWKPGLATAGLAAAGAAVLGRAAHRHRRAGDAALVCRPAGGRAGGGACLLACLPRRCWRLICTPAAAHFC